MTNPTNVHRHAWCDRDVIAATERPPEVRLVRLVEVTFRRGEGCCQEDVVRECRAFYDLEGNLVTVIDPKAEFNLNQEGES